MLRKGQIDRAIAAYAEVLEERPGDWPAANRLGDLYIQAGKTDEAGAVPACRTTAVRP